MKRLVPALSCIFAALLIGVSAFIYTSNKTKELNTQINTALDKSGAEFFTAAEDLYESWEKVQRTFGAFLKHSDADELAKLFYAIRDCVQTEKEDELRAALTECRTALRVIIEGEKMDVANVF